jgi:mannose-1-phosphate guanylyltransferase
MSQFLSLTGSKQLAQSTFLRADFIASAPKMALLTKASQSQIERRRQEELLWKKPLQVQGKRNPTNV